MRAAFLLLVPLTVFAAVNNVRVMGTTATQAVIAYTAPSQAACTLEVSESSTYLPLVHDVDTSLFAGANSDSRMGNLTNGLERVFVVGKRTSDVATDGNLYSRALQVYTTHYFRITCGSDVATGTFQTTNLPLGNTVVEQPPFNAAGAFNYAWPTISVADRTQKIIDPLTGVQIGRVTIPGDAMQKPMKNTLFNVAFDLNGHWANASNAISGSTSSLATCDTAAVCTTTDPLFVALDPSIFKILNYYWMGGWFPSVEIDDINLRVFGLGTDAVTVANRAVLACWTIDGQTCWSNTVEFDLPTTPGSVTGPSTYPSPGSSWGKYFASGIFGSTLGTVNVSGNTVTETGTGSNNFFKIQWAAGSKIYIAGSAPACPNNYCTIASVQNATTLTISQSLTLTGAAYSAFTTGILVTKKTSAGAVSISFNFDYVGSGTGNFPLDGATEYCSKVTDITSVAADGTPLSQPLTGRLCMAQSTGGALLYFLVPSTGEVRFLSNGFAAGLTGVPHADQFSTPASGTRIFCPDCFDPVDPRAFYITQGVYGTSGGAVSIFRVRYTGDYRQFNPNYASVNGADNLTYTNITPASTGMDLLSQVQASYPSYDASTWGSNFTLLFILPDDVGHAYGATYVDPGGQDAPCIWFFFDLTTSPYATLVAKADSFSGPTMRWAGCHTDTANKQYLRLSTKWLWGNYPGKVFYGPHKTVINEVRRNGVWPGAGQDTSLTATYAEACPSDLPQQWQALGATGNNCIFIRVVGEPCNWTPGANELAKYPCPWNANYSMLQPMIEGDWFVDNANGAGERLRIVRKVAYSGGFELTLQRFADPQCPTPAAKLNGWIPIMAPSFYGCSAVMSIIGPPFTTWIPDDATLTHNHHDMGAGVAPGNWTTAGWPGDVRYDQPASAFGAPGNISVGMTATKFASLQPPAAYSQSYISKRQWNAPASEQSWIIDLRSLNPNAGLGSEQPTNIASNTVTLAAGTTQVYQVSVVGAPVDPRRVPLVAYAGPYLLDEISSPNTATNTITDATAWTFCIANANGECRTNSTAGQVFVNVPNADVPSGATGCYTNQYARRIPCVISLFPQAAWVIQWDVSRNDMQGTRYRKLTMGLAGPGRQYHFANARSDPDGLWMFVPGFWLGGQRQDVLLAKLPPWPVDDSENRGTFLGVPVQIGSVPAGTNNVVVEFGYDTNYFCTGRQEPCVAASGTINEAMPFYWETSDTTNGVWNGAGLPCSAGCKILIPALSQRVLYYRVKYRDASNNLIGTGSQQVMTTN